MDVSSTYFRRFGIVPAAILFSVLVISGCQHGRTRHKHIKKAKVHATEEGYEQILDTWKGATEIELLHQWGVPTQTYQTSGHKFLVYQNLASYSLPKSYVTTHVGDYEFTDENGGGTMVISCTTTFEVIKDRIIAWQHKGNNCKAFPQITPTPGSEPTDSAN
jgi:hypothetical protein